MNIEGWKECPFCGEYHDIEVVKSQTPIIHTKPTQYKREVMCNSCFCVGPPKDTHNEAVMAWEVRHNYD